METEDEVKMPRRATMGSAGYDFFSPDTYWLEPRKWTMIDTGVRLTNEAIRCVNYSIGGACGTTLTPVGVGQWFMMLVPRSGLSNKYGFRIRNTIGIIDMDYKDTIKAMVTVDEPYTLQKNEKFLQGIFMPFGISIGEIEPSEMRAGGQGSTGRF